MVDERPEPAAVDPAGQWQQICLYFHDLLRGAREVGLGQRFRELTDGGGDDLAEWLALAEQIRDRRRQVLGVAMHSIDELAAELARWGIAEHDRRGRDYRCPDGRCSRLEPALFDEAPDCDLLGQHMIKAESPA